MSDNGIGESYQKEGVVQVAFHLSALCDCSGDNTRQSAGKSKLKEPIGTIDITHQEKIFGTDERPLAC